jgi:hypothetical protein
MITLGELGYLLVHVWASYWITGMTTSGCGAVS